MKIVIADDHHLIADGFINTIGRLIDTAVCFPALSLAELKNLLATESPDVLFQDIRFGKHNAREFIKQIIEANPHLKVIIISSIDDAQTVKVMLNQGVHGYILKSDSLQYIPQAIGTVLSGEIYLSPDVKLLSSERELLFGAQSGPALTPREKAVLCLIANEKSTKEIATELFLSEKSIENYRSNLLLKFDAKNVAGLIKKALLKGFI